MTRSKPTLPSTIDGVHREELVIKKSRFIASAAHVTTVDEAQQFIAAVRSEFWDARHHCLALSVGKETPSQRSSDDGEPSGTAGIPMLEVLRARNLTDVVVVVSRYFGGTLLGAGGLVRAYSSATSGVLDGAPLVERRWLSAGRISTDHAHAGRVEYFLRDWLPQHGGHLDDVIYGSEVEFSFAVPESDLMDKALSQSFSGSISAEYLEEVIR
ncbi:IMPACT family protein [Jonesia quinghaiensis]|uniref:IMPACT family protein n=1 Tax=Jonesia quinghaiensis TaxID=262806 RepID=UPI00040D9880|nr:YigZ family protein [Jonesia quinghaiensis]